jgi:ATP-binding cassette subfamily F protein 3
MREFNKKSQRDIEKQIRREKEVVQTLRHHRKISAFNSRLKKIEKLEEELTLLKRDGAAMHLGRIPSAVINLDHDVHISKEVAKAEELTKSFGSRTLFEEASFLIKGGEKVGIIGDNGTGKTTLLNILSGKDSDFKGQAALGSWIRYGYISQDIVFQNESITVLEKIIEESNGTRTGRLEERQALEYAANFKFFGDETRKKLAVLSGGEKSRLALAIVLLDKPNCLVMDEPTNHLDIYTKEIMQDAFYEFEGTVIAISHDRYFLDNCIQRIIALEDGKINVYEGNYSYYLGCHKPDEEERPSVKEEKYRIHKKKLENKRREKARVEKRKKLLTLETSIQELEEFKDLFEADMDENTSYDEYLSYQDKLKELEALYRKWEVIGNEDDLS